MELSVIMMKYSQRKINNINRRMNSWERFDKSAEQQLRVKIEAKLKEMLTFKLHSKLYKLRHNQAINQ